LLPGASLPLHIFEPRYREMTAECLDQKKPFGVVRAKEDGISDIGCTAEILKVVKEYPDGRSDILTQGGRRFEVMQVSQERSFLQAEVLYLHDEPGAATAAEVAQAVQLHAELMTLAGADPEAVTAESPDQLSFRLAGPLPLDLDFKQNLLGMKSEGERLRMVISYFETILPSIKRSVQVRQKAGGNGHAI
jgi:Lon protease-like protein